VIGDKDRPIYQRFHLGQNVQTLPEYPHGLESHECGVLSAFLGGPYEEEVYYLVRDGNGAEAEVPEEHLIPWGCTSQATDGELMPKESSLHSQARELLEHAQDLLAGLDADPAATASTAQKKAAFEWLRSIALQNDEKSGTAFHAAVLMYELHRMVPGHYASKDS